jgi:hypothetical protein
MYNHLLVDQRNNWIKNHFVAPYEYWNKHKEKKIYCASINHNKLKYRML